MDTETQRIDQEVPREGLGKVRGTLTGYEAGERKTTEGHQKTETTRGVCVQFMYVTAHLFVWVCVFVYETHREIT